MERRSSLHELHVGAGARFLDLAGWLVPGDFGGLEAEYEALCSRAALFDLSFRGKLRATGRDRVAFLNNMLTNDLRGLEPGRGCHAAKLTVQGKMEAAIQVLCTDDALLCDVDPGALGPLQASLAKHLIMEDVKLDDVTDSVATLSIQGPAAARVVAALGTSIEPPREDLDHLTTVIEGMEVRLVRHDRSGETGYDLWISSDDAPRIWKHVLLRGEDALLPVGVQALDLRRIENGIPWHGSEITSEYFPIEAGLEEGWISYTKGCYLGQETISRLHHMGHANRSLCGLEFEGTAHPTAGALLRAGDKKVGRVTSAARSLRTGNPMALAYVHREFTSAGTQLVIETEGKRWTATVADFPLA